jgi:hypothetical protein
LGWPWLDEFQLTETAPLLWDYSIAVSAQSLLACFQSVVSNEIDEIKGCRTVVQKQLLKLQTRPVSGLSNAVNSSTHLQKFLQFESQSLARYDDIQTAHNGIGAALEFQLAGINELASEKTPRGLTVFLRPSSAKENFDTLRDKLRSFLLTERDYLSAVADSVLASVNSMSL